MTVVTTHPPGEPTWVDLMTSDPAGARAFYGGLFDWTFDIGTPETFGYTMCFKGGHRVAGMGQKPPDMPMPTRDIDSTPPAMTMSSPPWAILPAAKLIASSPDAQKREIWMPGALLA